MLPLCSLVTLTSFLAGGGAVVLNKEASRVGDVYLAFMMVIVGTLYLPTFLWNASPLLLILGLSAHSGLLAGRVAFQRLAQDEDNL